MDIEISNLARKVFRLGKSKKDVIAPPHQVFINPDFHFLLTLGGYLVDNAEEYNKLMEVLKNLDETGFHILENLGATTPCNDEPYQNTFSVDSTFEKYKEAVDQFDPPFGIWINHFYVFGQNENWGIYICEYPAINIIGCVSSLKNKFAEVFNIKGNGFPKLESFIDQELRASRNPNLKAELMKNYNLFTSE